MAKPLRAVIDTNAWVSTMIVSHRTTSSLLRALQGGRFFLVTSERLLQELHGALLHNRKLREDGFTREDVDATVAYFRDQSVFGITTGSMNACSHEPDNRVIETAITGKANVIVSDNEHLFEPAVVVLLAEYNISVLSVKEFLKLISE